jgi:hypothetical protein
MTKKNNGKGDDDKKQEPTFWRYWKKTILEDIDELREIIVELKLEQARIKIEQDEIELRLNLIQDFITEQLMLERDGEEDDR